MAGCSHPVIYGGLCGVCGVVVENATTSLVPMSLDRKLHATFEEAEKVERDLQEKLKAKRKLSLVLDLDHTLLHATHDPRAAALLGLEGMEDLHSFELHPGPPGYPPQRHFVKLRPGLRKFLEQASQLFELHIYTMGTKEYAGEVTKIIDPGSRYFATRIVSREGQEIDAKNLKRIFPVDDSMVIIIDDRLDVWGTCKNVIRIEAFHFWRGLSEVNMLPQDKDPKSQAPTPAAPFSSAATTDNSTAAAETKASSTTPSAEATSPSTPESKDASTTGSNGTTEGVKSPPFPHGLYFPEAQKDEELSRMWTKLSAIHQKFYELVPQQGTPDVKRIMYDMRSQVLRGLRLSFTGIFPLGADPKKYSIWMLAEAFGAKCMESLVDPKTKQRATHLIAMKPGTQKVNEATAKYPDIKIVHLDWLGRCFLYWERQDESKFSLSAVSVPWEPLDYERSTKSFYLAYAEGYYVPEADMPSIPPARRRRGSSLYLGSGEEEEGDRSDGDEEFVYSNGKERKNGYDSEDDDMMGNGSDSGGSTDDSDGESRKRRRKDKRRESDNSPAAIKRRFQEQRAKKAAAAAAASKKRKTTAPQISAESKKPKVDITADDEDLAAMLESEFE